MFCIIELKYFFNSKYKELLLGTLTKSLISTAKTDIVYSNLSVIY